MKNHMCVFDDRNLFKKFDDALDGTFDKAEVHSDVVGIVVNDIKDSMKIHNCVFDDNILNCEICDKIAAKALRDETVPLAPVIRKEFVLDTNDEDLANFVQGKPVLVKLEWHDAKQEPPPKKSEYYLVYDNDFGMFGVSEYFNNLNINKSAWSWWIEYKEEKDFHVTHWTECPAPPK